MRTSVACAVFALAASAAGLPAASDLSSRQHTSATWIGLSWSVDFATCKGKFDSKTLTVGAWTLCHRSSNSSTVEGQLLSPDGDFQINVRQNATVDRKTTVVTGTGVAPDHGETDFTLGVTSVETTS
ncbi:hypothetical protein F5Y08DRAFT_339473 [Xylaria arbuscula]|nr:hypothetical protein F5Y08DRAFT_339473 [Xylaria arbuscula]